MADASLRFKQMFATVARRTRLGAFNQPISHRLLGLAARRVSTAACAVEQKDNDETAQWRPQSDSQPSPAQPTPEQSRLNKLRAESEPRMLSSFLTDKYARQHNYLRISVTERCNLRCLYCMPEEGIPLSPPERLLTTPEIVYLSELFVDQGVNKIRLTGGEPTVRRDIVDLMHQIGNLRSKGLKEMCITTNGISLHRKLDSMVNAGLTGVNLSLDTLDPFQFQIMTRRNGHEAVMKSIHRILEMNKLGAGVKLKINCVVMRGLNEREILPFVELGRDHDLEVRFIEYMPFDGNKWSENKMLSYGEMLALIRQKYPNVSKVQDHKNDTSKTFKIPGFAGRMGFITSMTHNFCGTCNRLRITSDGNIKVCLFDNAEVSLRDILRESNGGKPIDSDDMNTIKELERRQQLQSEHVSNVPALSRKQNQLLEIIGMAVNNKKEKHAGMGELENMKNRPMILIDDAVSERSPTQYRILSPSITSGSHIINTPPRIIPLHLLGPAGFKAYRHSRPFSTGHAATSWTRRMLMASRQRVRPRRTALRTVRGQSLWRELPSEAPDEHADTKYGSGENCSRSGDSSRSGNLLLRDELVEDLPREILFEGEIDPTQVRAHSSATESGPATLNHLNASGEAHMVSITGKGNTVRSATATCFLFFSLPNTLNTLLTSQLKKGDAIAVARIAGIQAAKKTADLIPLAHPLAFTGMSVEIDPYRPKPGVASGSPGEHGGVFVRATVECEGKTGVEMEAMVAASTTGLTLYDMLKGVDKGMCLGGIRVVAKSGGKSGSWVYDYLQKRIVKKAAQKTKTTEPQPMMLKSEQFSHRSAFAETVEPAQEHIRKQQDKTEHEPECVEGIDDSNLTIETHGLDRVEHPTASTGTTDEPEMQMPWDGRVSLKHLPSQQVRG